MYRCAAPGTDAVLFHLGCNLVYCAQLSLMLPQPLPLLLLHFLCSVQRIYVTLFPCNECAKLLIQAGIREVVYHEVGAATGVQAEQQRPVLALHRSPAALHMQGKPWHLMHMCRHGAEWFCASLWSFGSCSQDVL
jgi:hypothetical protein